MTKPEVGGATKLKTVSWRTHDAAAREFDAGAMGHAFERKDVAKVDTGVKGGEKVGDFCPRRNKFRADYDLTPCGVGVVVVVVGMRVQIKKNR